MHSNKPLIEGCQAVIISGKHKGEEVILGPFIGAMKFTKVSDIWMVNKPLSWSNNVITIHLPMCSARILKRIDKYDGDKLSTWDECAWKTATTRTQA